MLITLTHDIIVNDGKKAGPRKKGEKIELRDVDARLLIINKQAVEYTAPANTK